MILKKLHLEVHYFFIINYHLNRMLPNFCSTLVEITVQNTCDSVSTNLLDQNKWNNLLRVRLKRIGEEYLTVGNISNWK